MFVGIDGEYLSTSLLESSELIAQLRELSMTDRSCVAVDEDEHDGLFPAELA